MIDFSKITAQIIEKLSQNDYFVNFKIISAFEPRQNLRYLKDRL